MSVLKWEESEDKIKNVRLVSLDKNDYRNNFMMTRVNVGDIGIESDDEQDCYYFAKAEGWYLYSKNCVEDYYTSYTADEIRDIG